MEYIVKRVKILDIHEDDAFYGDRKRYIGQIVDFIEFHDWNDGWVGGDAQADGCSHHFYKVKVQEILDPIEYEKQQIGETFSAMQECIDKLLVTWNEYKEFAKSFERDNA